MQLLPRNEPLLRRSGLRRQSNTQPHPGKAAARFMFEVSMLGSDVVSSSPGCKDFCGPSWRTSSPERCAGLTVKLRPITRGRNILIASPACRRRLPGRPAGIPRAVALGIDQDRADYTVSAASGISAASMKSEANSEHLRWFWALHFPSKPESLRTDNRVATLEAAKAEFEASWEARRAWAKLEEAP